MQQINKQLYIFQFENLRLSIKPIIKNLLINKKDVQMAQHRKTFSGCFPHIFLNITILKIFTDL